MTQRTRPLDGITVISLEHAVAAPFCTRQLADLGARVIKVERPGSGDFARGYDQRVRPVLALHLDQPQQGKPGAGRQAAPGQGRADAALEDRRRAGAEPGTRRRRAHGPVVRGAEGTQPAPDRLRHQRLRRRRPYRDKKAYDLLIQSEAGFLSVTGTPETPSKAGISVADIAAGMYAYTTSCRPCCCAGTGEGSHIDVSMLEAMGEWMGYPMYYAFDGAPPPPRTGASHASIYPYGRLRPAMAAR
jgi:crotonobetainyl-CoA:carnitine CoA-transferase CaiB-like acyl-CoA transferase